MLEAMEKMVLFKKRKNMLESGSFWQKNNEIRKSYYNSKKLYFLSLLSSTWSNLT